MEKSIRDLKAALDQRAFQWQAPPAQLSIQLEASLHHLNHRPRRCIQGRTPCEASMTRLSVLRCRSKPAKPFSDCSLCAIARPWEQWNQAITTSRPPWRLTVEHWLRCQNWIAITTNKKPK